MAFIILFFYLMPVYPLAVQSRLTTFHIIQKNMSPTEAQTACRTNYTDLVTLYSEEDNTTLYNMMKTADIIKAWIGLYRGQSSDKWSNGDAVTFSNETGDCGTGVCCTAMKPDGSWESLKCTEKRYSMCYKEDDNCSLIYHVIHENMSWYDAQRYCRKNYTDLVSIRDQQQNEEVKIQGGNSTTSFWIGLLYDDWEWSDGGSSAYRNWETGSPRSPSTGSNCVQLFNGKWNGVPCSNQPLPALCSHRNASVFHIIQEKVNQTEAQKVCRKNYTDLVTLYSEEDNPRLYNLMKRANITKAWIGLYRGQSSAKWSNGDNATFINVTRDCGAQDCCTAMKHDGSWKSLNCTDKRHFMCYKKDKSDSLPTYHLIYNNMSWYNAQSSCRRKNTDLVSISNQTQNEEVKIKGGNSTTSFWIGLLHDDWKWRDGGSSAYRNWGTGSPKPANTSSNCTVMQITSGKRVWYSVPCSNSEYVICS